MYIIGIDIGKNHHEALLFLLKENKSDILFVLQPDENILAMR